VALLASYYGLYRYKHSCRTATEHLSRRDGRLMLAGIWAGVAVMSNYLAAAVVVLLGLYLVAFTRMARHLAAFCSGVLLSLLVLAAYHLACFGTPLTTSYAYQNPAFRAYGATILGVLEPPQADRLAQLLFSPFRGLFISSPVLLMGVVGWVLLVRQGRCKADAWLFASILVLFLFFNCSFNGWTGGYGAGPRYLVPALPFLALPLVLAAQRYFKSTTILTALSVLLFFVSTAVDPQCPLGVSPTARVIGRPLWCYSPLTEYEIPLLLWGRPEPFLRSQADALWARANEEAQTAGLSPTARAQRLAAIRAQLDHALAACDARIFPLCALPGPVSVNPQGVYEGGAFRLFQPGSGQARWNSFNAGEFLFPGSRLSLAPLLLGVGVLALLSWFVVAKRRGRANGETSASADASPVGATRRQPG
jgi:hypothetical protein